MTKTPLEEMLDAIAARSGVLTIFDVPEVEPANRTDTIKRIWAAAIITAPPGALDGPDGPVMMLLDPDDEDGKIEYDLITYGDKRVIEAEGVIVCRLIG